jgi:hypothetical protein
VTSLASGLVALPDDVCPDYADTGYGKQVQPLAQGSNGGSNCSVTPMVALRGLIAATMIAFARGHVGRA